MTRKHFNALALALHNVKPSAAVVSDPWVNSVRAVADVCATANTGFDRQRFIEACFTGKV